MTSVTSIYIEVFIVMICLGLVGTWFIWKTITDKINVRRYKPENDKARQDDGTRPSGREQITEEPNDNVARSSEPEQRELLPATNVISTGEDSKRSRKPKFLRRIRRRKGGVNE